MLLTLNGFVFGASYGAPKERFSKTCSLHPSDAVQGLGCSPTSILQRKNGIYIRVKIHLVSTMRLLKTPPKFDNHFARMIVRFQAQLEADGCFSARKSSEFATAASRASWYQLTIFESDFTNPTSKTIVGLRPNPIFSTKLRRLRILADDEQANFLRKNLSNFMVCSIQSRSPNRTY